MTLAHLNKHPLAHGAYAAVFIAPFMTAAYVFSMAVLTYAAAWTVNVFFYSRELRDAQSKAGIDAHKRPFALLFPWQWHSASQWDYYSALVVSVVMGLIQWVLL